MGAQHRRRAFRGHRWLIGALVAAGLLLAVAGTAMAARMYVAVGDSVGAGTGATAGHSYFDLYCAYLKSAGRVDQCVNESQDGMTSSSALSGGAITKVLNDIATSTDTPVVTVILGGNDLLGLGCTPVTAGGCPFDQNMATILGDLQTALAVHPGSHLIQWLEYYNPNHDNPFGTASQDGATAGLLLGSDLSLSDCSSSDPAVFGLNDEVNCIAQQHGATPVDAYTLFEANCTLTTVCFSDSLHPNDTGYALIFDALSGTTPIPVPPVPAMPPRISSLSESRRAFVPGTPRHKHGITFSFVISAQANVIAKVERELPGRRVGARCLSVSPRRRDDRRCTRTQWVTTLAHHAHAGHNSIWFSGDRQGRRLAPGSYRASVSVAGAAPGPAQTLRFRILRP